MFTAITRRILLALIVLVVLIGYGVTRVTAQPSSYTYTISWQQDGVGVDSYGILVDGTLATVPLPTCLGSGVARTCTTTLPMTLGADHTVIVVTNGTFGSVNSDPFAANRPGKAQGVAIKK